MQALSLRCLQTENTRLHAELVMRGDLAGPSLMCLFRGPSLRHCVLGTSHPFAVTLFSSRLGWCCILPQQGMQVVDASPSDDVCTGQLVEQPSGVLAAAMICSASFG